MKDRSQSTKYTTDLVYIVIYMEKDDDHGTITKGRST